MNHFLLLFFRSLLANFFCNVASGRQAIYVPSTTNVSSLSLPGSAMDYFRHIQLPCPYCTMNINFQAPDLAKWENFQTWVQGGIQPPQQQWHQPARKDKEFTQESHCQPEQPCSSCPWYYLITAAVILKAGSRSNLGVHWFQQEEENQQGLTYLRNFFQTLFRSHWVFHSQFYLGKNSQFINIIF